MKGSNVITSAEITGGGTLSLGGEPGSSFILRVIPGTAVPKEYALRQNYPNPFNPITRIDYALPADSRVKITVYDITGKEVVTLVDGVHPAGYGHVDWDGRNASGTQVGSGVYFYRIEATGAGDKGNYTAVRKMVLLR